MRIFYAPDILTNPVLPEIESGHCIRVLRQQTGDIIDISDGKGFFYKGKITEAHQKKCRIEIVETLAVQKPWTGCLEIAVAPTKNMDRMEWFAEKATEIGIDRISFIKSRYSERKEIKTERIEKIAVSAMKQSEKALLPDISEMIEVKQFIHQSFSGRKFIAHCYPGEKPLLSKIYKGGEDATILIGPEGDFSEEEVEAALKCGFEAISLGESRLRTETAALTALQTLHIINQIS